MNIGDTIHLNWRATLLALAIAFPGASSGFAGALDHWHRRDAGASNYITAATYDPAAKVFVAVDGAGPFDYYGPPSALLTSSNGRDWSRQVVGTNNLLTDRIAHGNGQYRAVRYSQYAAPMGELLRSTDGVEWMVESLDFEGDNPVVKAVEFLNGQWLVAGGPSGQEFNPIPCGEPFGPPCPEPALKVFFSANGTSWRTADLEVPPFGFGGIQDGLGLISADFAYGNGAWVVLAWVYRGVIVDGAPESVALLSWRSTDGTNFVRGPVLVSTQAMLANAFEPMRCSLVFGNGSFVAVAGGGSVYASANGLSWTTNSAAGASVRDVAFGGGQFVAVGASGGFTAGAIVTSSDGVNWQERAVATTEFLRQVEYGCHSFVAIGGTNLVLQSDPVVMLSLANSAGLQFTLSAPESSSCRIEFTSDFNSSEPWQVLTNFVVPADPFLWPAPALAEPRRFYRAVLQP